MLSEYEQRELRNIEQMLLSDSRLSASFRHSKARAARRTTPFARAVVGIGVLIMVLGALLGLGETFVQGLGIAVLGLVWSVYGPGSPPRRRMLPRVRPRD